MKKWDKSSLSVILLGWERNVVETHYRSRKFKLHQCNEKQVCSRPEILLLFVELLNCENNESLRMLNQVWYASGAQIDDLTLSLFSTRLGCHVTSPLISLFERSSSVSVYENGSQCTSKGTSPLSTHMVYLQCFTEMSCSCSLNIRLPKLQFCECLETWIQTIIQQTSRPSAYCVHLQCFTQILCSFIAENGYLKDPVLSVSVSTDENRDSLE